MFPERSVFLPAFSLLYFFAPVFLRELLILFKKDGKNGYAVFA